MKKHFLFVSFIIILFSSCTVFERFTVNNDSTNHNKTTNSKEANKDNEINVLSDIFNGVFGRQSLSVKKLTGKWDYKGSSAIFETEDMLKKAGGAVVAEQVESELNENFTKLGIKASNTYFNFNADSTYTAKIAGVSISGKYTVNPSTKKVKMKYLMGVGSIEGTVILSRNKMKLLFKADSMLKLMKILSQFTENTAIEVLAKMSDMYDGLLLGFDLRKQ